MLSPQRAQEVAIKAVYESGESDWDDVEWVGFGGQCGVVCRVIFVVIYEQVCLIQIIFKMCDSAHGVEWSGVVQVAKSMKANGRQF